MDMETPISELRMGAIAVDELHHPWVLWSYDGGYRPGTTGKRGLFWWNAVARGPWPRRELEDVPGEIIWLGDGGWYTADERRRQSSK